MKDSKWLDSVRHFFEVLKPMTWAERFDHIFTYYKEFVFVVGVGILVISVLLFSALNSRNNVVFGGVFANLDINLYGYNYLTDGFLEKLDTDSITDKVDLTSTAFKTPENLSELDSSYNAAMKPIGMIEDGTLDYFVMDEEAMMFYMTQDALMDLREVFTEDELAQMEDLLIYLEFESDHTRYPVAIRVNHMQFFIDCVEVENPVFFSFASTEKDVSTYRLFWEYLNNWTALESADS